MDKYDAWVFVIVTIGMVLVSLIITIDYNYRCDKIDKYLGINSTMFATSTKVITIYLPREK